MAVDPARLTPIPLFASLTDEQRASVAAKFEERHADPGHPARIVTVRGVGYRYEKV